MTIKDFSTDYSPTIQAVAAVLALASLLQVWWQIRKTNSWNRISAAFGLMDLDQFDALEKDVIAGCAKIGIRIPKELTAEEAKLIRENNEAYHAMKPFIIFIERLCVAVRSGYADERVAYHTYGAIVRGYYTVLKAYIAAARVDGNAPEAYRDFEKVAVRFERRYLKTQARLNR